MLVVCDGGPGIWMPLCALQVNFSDVAHNPSLARAARAELNGRPPADNAFAQSSTLLAGRPHDAEVSSTFQHTVVKFSADLCLTGFSSQLVPPICLCTLCAGLPRAGHSL